MHTTPWSCAEWILSFGLASVITATYITWADGRSPVLGAVAPATKPKSDAIAGTYRGRVAVCMPGSNDDVVVHRGYVIGRPTWRITGGIIVLVMGGTLPILRPLPRGSRCINVRMLGRCMRCTRNVVPSQVQRTGMIWTIIIFRRYAHPQRTSVADLGNGLRRPRSACINGPVVHAVGESHGTTQQNMPLPQQCRHWLSRPVASSEEDSDAIQQPDDRPNKTFELPQGRLATTLCGLIWCAFVVSTSVLSRMLDTSLMPVLTA